MLTVHSKDYFAPMRNDTWSDEPAEYSWVLMHRIGSDRIVSTVFQYTFPIQKLSDGSTDRITLVYDRTKVKPSPRSLRVYGFEVIGVVIRYMSLFSKNAGNVGLLVALNTHLRDFGFTTEVRPYNDGELVVWDVEG